MTEGKKPPLTKAEKAKKQKEEAERKIKEEEEAKIRAEKEEAERIERERLKAEERARQDKEERKKIKWQIPELDAILTNNRNTLNALELEATKANQWARYMRCDGSPDPTILPEINMYMSLWREDRLHADIESILKESDLVLQLIDELEDRLEEGPPEGLSRQYSATILELQEILQEKLDIGTHDLLLKASSMAAPDTDLIKCMQNDNITICVWVNLSKNPRVKSFDFDMKGMVFELNSFLNRSDCVVRALFTKFDHLSHLSKSYLPQIKKIPVSETDLQEESSSPTGEEKALEEIVTIEPEVEEKEDRINRLMEEIGGKTKSTLGFSDSEEEEADLQAEEEEEEEFEEEDDNIDLADYGLISPEPIDYEDFDEPEEIVDLRAYHVIGGVFHINLLQIPPQPKVIKNWTVTILVEPPELTHLEYELTAVSDVVQDAEEGEAGEGNKDKLLTVEKRPLMVTMRLPDGVCFCEEPQVVRFDHANKVWRTDGFTDKIYNESTRQLTFRMHQFGTMALMQDTHINMPFQSWELRPRGVNHAQLTIIAAVVEVEFQIKDGLICLSQPEDKPELANLINKYMPVHKLIQEMKYAGVNVFPSIDSHKYVKIADKNLMTEDRFYRQVGLVGSAMAFSWSKWNTEITDKEKLVIQTAQHVEDQPLIEEDWSLILVTKRRITKLKMTEFSEEFSEEHAENTDFHSNLYHLTMEIADNDLAKQRIEETSAEFSEVLYHLLRSTRVLVYS